MHKINYLIFNQQKVVKRLFDIVFSATALLVFSPFFVVICILILFSGKGGVFFRQLRVGRNNQDFRIFKFRTMKPDADKSGLLTVGMKDNRITKVGYYLRKFKMDEVPQLINVLLGDMSVVGPRPELRKYVDLYNAEQMKVLSVRPGITDFASLKYFNENEVLGKSANPEKTYIEEVMVEKLTINMEYISNPSLFIDLKVIAKTIFRIFGF
jgi:lipopolysaccharide/colanic/teichoic acid biosynthesis glycosyltransferase